MRFLAIFSHFLDIFFKTTLHGVSNGVENEVRNVESDAEPDFSSFWSDYLKTFKTSFTNPKIRAKLIICLVCRICQMSSSIPLLAFYSLGLLQRLGLSSQFAGVGSLVIYTVVSFMA